MQASTRVWLNSSSMPLLPAPLERISKIWEISAKETESILDTLVGKGLVYEDDFEGSTLYTLAIPVFFLTVSFEISLLFPERKFITHDGSVFSTLVRI